MRNLNKTVAAGVLGVALLAGTAGTFATWQNDASVPAGTIVTGNMDVALEWANTWYIRTPNGNIPAGADLSTHPLIPGQSAYRNLRIIEDLTGLTINDVTLKTEWGSLNLDKDGYLLRADGTRSQLRFTIITKSDVNDWMFRNPELNVIFERSSDYGMYEEGIDNLNLGDIVVTITQK